MVFLALAGAAAGAINAVAGGGSLVSFPALLALGHPALTANVTNTVAIWPGYVSGAAGYRAELVGDGRRMRAVAASAGIGAVVGSVLLLRLPSEVFDRVVPWCVLFSAGVLAVQPRVGAWLRARPGRRARAEHEAPALHATLVVAGAYGAYFGGGLGVVLLAALGVFLADGLHRLTGLKNWLALLVNSVALAAFVVAAPVAWSAVAVVAPAAFLGGSAGARLGRRVPAGPLRVLIVVAGLVVGVVLLVR